MEEGMRKVQEGNFAYHTPLAPAYGYILEKFTNYDICALQVLEGYANVQNAITSILQKSV